MRRFALAVCLGLAAITLSPPVTAQTAWGPRSPVNSPGGRNAHVLVHDPIRQRTLLFGGLNRGTALGDSWEWDGDEWTQLAPATSPSRRWGAGACFDEVRGRIILFGGWDGSTLYGDTWEWTGADWQIMFPTGPARELPGLAFDPVSRRPVLFGGGNRGTPLGDMWQLTPTGWQRLTPAALPPATIAPLFCADPTRSEIVLDGGSNNTGTWIWNGLTWTRSAASRGHYGSCASAYDSLRRRVVAFEGVDTWEWTGSAWLRRYPGLTPPTRGHARLTFDAGRQRVLLFGGVGSIEYGDTWEYHLFAPANQSVFGQGCVGSIGQRPLVAARDNTLPWIGEDWVIDVTRLPPLSVNAPFGVIGMSNTSWLGVPLPLDLGFAGAPGCALLTSADTSIVPLTNTGGRATWAITLPLDLRTLGVPFYIQAAVLDYGVNALNLIVSNGAAAIPGMK